jgi:cardiolipin-specific phospholipase
MKRKGSEVAISVILGPFLFARRPLVDRIPLLKMPITFMYGDYDWMESGTALKMCKDDKVIGKVFVVPDAGHHLYIENPVQCVARLLS